MIVSILKKIAPVPKLTEFDNFLFVGPHPDDIEMACGCSVATLVQMKKKVSFVIATNGCVGSVDQSIEKEKLVAMRKQEALASAKMLGVDDVTFLPFDDGALYQTDDMMKELAKIYVEKQPDVIFAPDHKVKTECHPDHLKTGEAATSAFNFCQWQKMTAVLGLDKTAKPKCMAFYYTDKPNAFIPIGKNFQLKMEALRCHKSQFLPEELDMFEKYFKLRNFRYRNRDAYRALAPLHMHCFPEAAEF